MCERSPSPRLAPECLDQTLKSTREALHPRCFVCGSGHPSGLQVDFRPVGEDTVEGHFSCPSCYEGLPGRVHGGVVASLLDGAMANCLMAQGIHAVTADLRVRFLHPVDLQVEALIRAHKLEQRGSLHDLEASLIQGGVIKARAQARFYDGQETPWP